MPFARSPEKRNVVKKTNDMTCLRIIDELEGNVYTLIHYRTDAPDTTQRIHKHHLLKHFTYISNNGGKSKARI